MNIPHASRYANQNGGYRQTQNRSNQRGRSTFNPNAGRGQRPNRAANTSRDSGFSFTHFLIGGVMLFMLLKIIF